MAFGGSSRGVRSEINITPLVDVVLVLLIIFMVIAPSLAPDAVRLPTTDRPASRTDDGRHIEVVVGTGGQLWVDGRPTTPERLPESMREAAAGRADWDVVLKGDATLRFSDVERAMRDIEAAGFEGVGLIAERRAES